MQYKIASKPRFIAADVHQISIPHKYNITL